MKHIEHPGFASVDQLLEVSQTHETLSIAPRRQVSAESTRRIATSTPQACVRTRDFVPLLPPSQVTSRQSAVLPRLHFPLGLSTVTDQWRVILHCFFLMLPTEATHFFLLTVVAEMCVWHM